VGVWAVYGGFGDRVGQPFKAEAIMVDAVSKEFLHDFLYS